MKNVLRRLQKIFSVILRHFSLWQVLTKKAKKVIIYMEFIMNLKEKIKHLSTKLKERKLLKKWKSWTKERPLPNYLSPKILPHFHQDKLTLNDRNLIYIGSLKKKKIKKVEDQDKKNISQTENTENSQATIDASSPELKKDLIYTKASPVSSFVKRTLPVMVASAFVAGGGYEILTQDEPPRPSQDFQDGSSLDTGDDEINRDEEGNIIVTPPVTNEDKNQYVDMLENYLIKMLANRGAIKIDSVGKIDTIALLPFDDKYDRISILLSDSDDEKYEVNFILDKEAEFVSTDQTSIGDFVDFLQKESYADTASRLLNDKNNNLLVGEQYFAYQTQDNGDGSREFEFMVIPFHNYDENGIQPGYYRALSSQVNDDPLVVLANQLKSQSHTPFTYSDCEEDENFNAIADLFNSYKQALSSEME